jgi:hypothetical protein
VPQSSGTTETLRDVHFTDNNTGYSVGISGTILRTTNGGANWISQNIGQFLMGIFFSDKDNGTVVGYNGTIMRTTNGGENWVVQISGSGTMLTDVSFTDINTGTVVGNYGTILKTINGGIITELEENAENYSKPPENFLLKQNYPNPFNPTTKIKFEIPDQARNDNALVTLKVYDILGREVAILVNEEKPAGEYEVEFDGADLPSGIYFYQLKTSNYSETKKMVLLK